MGNLARFTINLVGSDPPGFDANAGDVLTLKLEAPSGVVSRWTLDAPAASQSDAPSSSVSASPLTLVGRTSGTSVDVAPSGSATVTLPSECSSWTIRSRVNGGLDANGQPNPDYVFERVVSIRNLNGLRKLVANEQTQYTQSGQTAAQNDIVTLVSGLGPFDNAGLRNAAPIDMTDLGRVAFQLDTGELWVVLPKVPFGTGVKWGLMATPEEVFTGDFAALAATFSLTVRGDWDPAAVGALTGTQGTGSASWANRTGSASAITNPSGDGVGTASAGLNGHAGITINGTTQAGIMTMPVQGAPGTVNLHRWWVGRILSTPASGAGTLFASGGLEAVQIVAGQTTPAANCWQYNNGAGATTTGVVINVWHRGRASLTGSSSDQIRIGSHAPAPAATTNTAPGGTSRRIGTDSGGINKANFELLRYLEIEGTLANFLLFDADASAKARTFWTSAIEI
jgi:hypothetical protein